MKEELISDTVQKENKDQISLEGNNNEENNSEGKDYNNRV